MPAERSRRPNTSTLWTSVTPEIDGRSESQGELTGSARAGAGDQTLERVALERLEVLLVLQQAAERVDDDALVELALPQGDQRPGPVERLGDAGQLVEI